MAPIDAAPVLRQTPLHTRHLHLGARMVPFAGYDMPLQYKDGIIREHLHTRAAASLFDVSHMGQIALRARTGSGAEAARALETVVPADVLGLAPRRQSYTLFTDARGGVLDDLMVSNQEDHLVLVVNAACKEADEDHLRARLSQACDVERLADRALLALQGPQAEAALARLAPEVRTMAFMDARPIALMRETCLVSRSGYTGEDGFEISIRAEGAGALWDMLLSDPAVAPAGLGARDTLRLEAGLCLYGADLDRDTTPVEAALEWTVARARRPGGARPGGYPGADIIASQLAGGPSRRRVGLMPEGRAPVRAGVALFRREDDAVPIGVTTSGGYGISLDAPIAMGYLPTDAAAPGTLVFAEVRGKRLATRVVTLPFVAPHYKRR